MKVDFKKIRRAVSSPDKLLLTILRHSPFQKVISDKAFLSLVYRTEFGKSINWENPQTFNEKLQWLKIYNRKPEYTIMVDKYRVREYIAEKLGKEYLIPLLGVWDNPDEIDFDALPNQFVLKCNHNSGLGMCICKCKAKLDVLKVKTKLKEGLMENYYLTNREWPYKNVPKKIIAEKFMDSGTGEVLIDYKVLCFNGLPKLVEIHRNRFEDNYTQDFYDTNCNLTEIFQPSSPCSGLKMEKPGQWDKMLELSQVLAKDIPHVRVDWYIIEGQIYFGELTFFDGAGIIPFADDQDERLGKWIVLPEKCV